MKEYCHIYIKLNSRSWATTCKKHVYMTQTQPKHYSNKQPNINFRSIQINLLVAEIYSFYYGYAIFKQKGAERVKHFFMIINFFILSHAYCQLVDDSLIPKSSSTDSLGYQRPKRSSTHGGFGVSTTMRQLHFMLFLKHITTEEMSSIDQSRHSDFNLCRSIVFQVCSSQK